MKHSFAEVIESSLNHWKGQSWQWDSFPQFGSLITIETQERTFFGLVYDIQTTSIDPHRTPIAYQKSETELKIEQPQIFEFLHTTFSCLTVGYEQNNKLLYQFSPEPPKLHAFISYASREQIIHFFSQDQYLHLLFSYTNQAFALDELLLALLKRLSDTEILTETLLVQFLETFSLLTANDYRRLKIFLQRAEPLLSIAPEHKALPMR
jgi:hypothetical protein